jgi:hypothetical protein
MLIAEPLLAIQIIPTKEAEFPARFENWRRWADQRGLYQGHAGSIEGRYRSPQHWDPPDPRPPSINLPDAILVNRAYMHLAQIAPKPARVIQILVFKGKNWRPQWQAQKLGIHHTGLEEALTRAKQMLENQLRRIT